MRFALRALMGSVLDSAADGWQIPPNGRPRCFYDPPVLLNLRIDQIAEVRLRPLMRSLLIRSHQTRVARNIGGKDRSEAADRGRVVPGGNVH
jgi:hypothetical protein